MNNEEFIRNHLNLKEGKSRKPNTKFVAFLQDFTKEYPDANIMIDEVPAEFLHKSKALYDKDFKGIMWIAVSSASIPKYDYNTDMTRITSPDLEHLEKNGENLL